MKWWFKNYTDFVFHVFGAVAVGARTQTRVFATEAEAHREALKVPNSMVRGATLVFTLPSQKNVRLWQEILHYGATKRGDEWAQMCGLPISERLAESRLTFAEWMVYVWDNYGRKLSEMDLEEEKPPKLEELEPVKEMPFDQLVRRCQEILDWVQAGDIENICKHENANVSMATHIATQLRNQPILQIQKLRELTDAFRIYEERRVDMNTRAQREMALHDYNTKIMDAYNNRHREQVWANELYLRLWECASRCFREYVEAHNLA